MYRSDADLERSRCGLGMHEAYHHNDMQVHGNEFDLCHQILTTCTLTECDDKMADTIN